MLEISVPRAMLMMRMASWGLQVLNGHAVFVDHHPAHVGAEEQHSGARRPSPPLNR